MTRRVALPLGLVTVMFFVVSTGSAARESGASACPAAVVHYTTPAGAQALGFSGKTPPWVGSSHLVGFLFYYGTAQPRGAYIGTGGRAHGSATKILWWVRPSTTRSAITVTGRRLDKDGSFHSVFSVGGPNTFPSIISVPAAGCWRISAAPGPSGGGKVAGSFVFRASKIP